MESKTASSFNFEKIVDILIRIGVLLFLMGWCIDILRPFVLILIWAGVIAIAIAPMHNFFTKKLRMPKSLSAIVLALIMLSILLVPSWLVSQSLFGEINELRSAYKEGQALIPPPGPSTANWPAITKPILDVWKLASENLQSAVLKYSDHVKMVGAWIFSKIAGISIGILQFLISIIIACVFLVYSTSVGNVFTKLFIRLAGKSGEHFTTIVVTTVRSVVKGILGVAVIQATMAALGFFIAGVPYAGLWSVLVLILAIVQLGAGPVAIPVMIYMFSVSDTLTATLLSIWLIITLISDNILKPLLLGRGAAAPMLVVFLGAIGGFITSGFIGLFLGAIVLTIGYKLFMSWLDTPEASEVASS